MSLTRLHKSESFFTFSMGIERPEERKYAYSICTYRNFK